MVVELNPPRYPTPVLILIFFILLELFFIDLNYKGYGKIEPGFPGHLNKLTKLIYALHVVSR